MPLPDWIVGLSSTYYDAMQMLVGSGFVTFLCNIDRVRETFRWKGENCSTNEIGEILKRAPRCADQQCVWRRTARYRRPRREEVDFTTLSELVNRELASYARPVFIRIQTGLELTGTYKLLKGELRSTAYHPDRVKGPVCVMKPGSARYEVLDQDFYQQIQRGEAGY